MADEQHADFAVNIRIDYGLWPGDGYFLVRYSSVGWVAFDHWLLVDREGRKSELRPYRVGMTVERRPR